MQRFARNGYEVIANEREIRFLDRQTWGLGVLLIILSSCAAILALLTLMCHTVAGMAGQ